MKISCGTQKENSFLFAYLKYKWYHISMIEILKQIDKLNKKEQYFIAGSIIGRFSTDINSHDLSDAEKLELKEMEKDYKSFSVSFNLDQVLV